MGSRGDATAARASDGGIRKVCAMQGFRQKIEAVVYTMGKVGSSTVSTSIKKAGLACLDVHFWEKPRILDHLTTAFADPADMVPEHLLDSFLARNARKRQGRLKMISLIRNPIMRNISAVFQNLPATSAKDFDQAMERLRTYLLTTPDHWFMKDFLPTTGVNVFAMNFDRDADHYKWTTNAFDILLMKLEMPDERKSALLEEFLDHPVKLKRANEASSKSYYEVYRRIIENPALVRPTFVEECLSLKYYKKFYTDDDARELAKKYNPVAADD